MIDVGEIAHRLNATAATLAAQLLPNGHRSGNYWMASGISDTGQSASLAVSLSGSRQGKWSDFGNAGAGEEHGDMLDLLALVQFGGDRRAAIAEAKRMLGIVDDWQGPVRAPSSEDREKRARLARQRAENRQAKDIVEREAKMRGARALFLHADGRPIAGSPAERYLGSRGLSAAPAGRWPGSLRYHPEVYNKEAGVKIPAMLAQVFAWDGEKQVHVATHRTYLQHCRARGWCKIDSANARMALGPWSGGFIPIHRGSSDKSMTAMHPDEPVYIAEGIEKCLAIRMKMPEARIISGLNLRNMGAIVLPPQARRLVFVFDNDAGEAEQSALERVIARQQARGLEVSHVFPPPEYKDIDDWMVKESPEPAKVPAGSSVAG